MSAVLTRRRRSGRGRERDHRQPSLFSQVVAPPPRPDEVRPEDARLEELGRDEVRQDEVRAAVAFLDEPASERDDAPEEISALATRTLDEAISGLWGELVTGGAVDCPVCGSTMAPRQSAAAGVVGGRCESCATTMA